MCSVDNHSTRDDNTGWAASRVSARDGWSGRSRRDAAVATATAAAANGGRCRYATGGSGTVHGGDDW